MANEQAELFAAVDALLEQAAAQDTLPAPAERKRLREAAGVSQEQVARALKVRSGMVSRLGEDPYAGLPGLGRRRRRRRSTCLNGAHGQGVGTSISERR